MQLFYESLRKVLRPGIDFGVNLDRAQVIVADNVAEYFFSGTDQEFWDVAVDFPNIAPPFQYFFVEGHAPEKLVSRDFGVHRLEHNAGTRWGIFFSAADLRQDQPSLASDNLRWMISAECYLAPEGSPIPNPLYAWRMGVSPDGRLAPWSNTPSKRAFWMMPPGIRVTQKMAEEGNSVFIIYLFCSLLTGSFMHCRNVKMERHGEAVLDAKHPRRRRYGPRVPYHVLVIDPMRRILEREGQSQSTGIRQALHICRGHFKHYEEGSGLFGKYHGTFWWADAVRGSEGEGESRKHYEVRPPDR